MNLATFWTQITPGTTYIRCEVPAWHLPAAVCDLTFKDLAPDENGDPHMPRQQGDCAIWQYVGSMTRGALMAWQQEQGLRVLLEVDDNYLIPPPTASGWEGKDSDRAGEDRSTRESHRRIAGWCDGIICATEPLADAYRALNPNVFVCPNSVEPDDWDVEKPDDGVLRIGWAASSSHWVDAPLVRRALRWAAQQKDVEVWFLGTPPAGWGKGWFRNLPWTENLAQYRANLGVLDVGVCPLVDTQWSRGKSDLKALEYAMAGALPVMSDVPPYAPWQGGPGLFARSATDFEKAIRWCVFHREEAKAIARDAREYVLTERTIGKHIWKWREAATGSGARLPGEVTASR